MPAGQIMQLHACLCGGLCSCMHTCVAHTTSKAERGRSCKHMCGRLCRCMHANVAYNAACACMCGRLCACIHACVADRTCIAKYAIACILVWQIMQMYSCLFGTYNMCSGICGCMQPHACLCGRDCRACMPVWRMSQLHACPCGRYGMCSSMCGGMQPRAGLCGR